MYKVLEGSVWERNYQEGIWPNERTILQEVMGRINHQIFFDRTLPA
jgi:hypothetical protein